MNRQISEKIRLFGFAMTCVIVIYHCPSAGSALLRGDLDRSISSALEQGIGILGILAMSHFFSVTGYLLFQNYTLSRYPQKIKKRISSLLVPYVLWQLITAGLKLAVNGESLSLWDFVRRTFLFIPFPSNGALWYVYAVFFLALLSPLLLPLFRNKTGGWLAVLVLMTAAQLQTHISWQPFRTAADYGYIRNILTYLPAFLTGCFYGAFGSREGRPVSLKYIASALALGLIIRIPFPGSFGELALKLLPMAALLALPAPSGRKTPRVYSLTFLIYALHQPLVGMLCSLLFSLLVRIPLPGTLYNLLTRLGALALVIGLAALVHRLLSRLSPRLLGWLTGGRA